MKKSSLIDQPARFALLGGVYWGLTLFLGTLLSLLTGYGRGFFLFLGGLYPKYSISFPGAWFGLFFGFVDGFLLCYLAAFLRLQIKKKS